MTMSRWFRFYDEALNDPKVQMLPADDFKSEFMAALAGEESAFSGFISGPFTRPDAGEWAVIRSAVFERDSYTCTYCGAQGVQLECDHVIPVCKGGNEDMDNLTTASRDCNRSKGGKLLGDWKRD